MKQFVNLQRYPVDRLETGTGQRFVRKCRQQLNDKGSCLLPEFLLPGAVAAATADALAAAPGAHQVNHEFAYDDVDDEKLMEPVESLPADHPRRFASLTKIRFVAKDLIGNTSPVKRLHSWDKMADFIGRVMRMESAFPSACPLSGCVLTIAEKGELQDWHFDGNEFIVTLMLEAANKGGAFEYVTGLRSPSEGDDFEGISRVLKGCRDRVIQPEIMPGTLTLFRGRYNLHRAAPVGENSRRIMAVLSFETRPDSVGTHDYLNLFYGRSVADPD